MQGERDIVVDPPSKTIVQPNVIHNVLRENSWLVMGRGFAGLPTTAVGIATCPFSLLLSHTVSVMVGENIFLLPLVEISFGGEYFQIRVDCF